MCFSLKHPGQYYHFSYVYNLPIIQQTLMLETIVISNNVRHSERHFKEVGSVFY